MTDRTILYSAGNISGPWTIEWHRELPSTMERARHLAENGASSGTVVVADFQSRGRGTHGREWHAAPGSCLMFTVIARPAIELASLSELPYSIARTVAGFLNDRFGLEATVSRPNDVLQNGKKICGILCTSRVTGDRLDWLLCGVGLNTFMTYEQLPIPEATSLVVEGIESIPEHDSLLPELLNRLEWVLSGDRPSCA